MITPSQARAARALLAMKLEDVRAKTGISTQAISAFETEKSDPRASTIERLRAHYESEGLEFLSNSEVAGFGVRWRRPTDVSALLKK